MPTSVHTLSALVSVFHNISSKAYVNLALESLPKHTVVPRLIFCGFPVASNPVPPALSSKSAFVAHTGCPPAGHFLWNDASHHPTRRDVIQPRPDASGSRRCPVKLGCRRPWVLSSSPLWRTGACRPVGTEPATTTKTLSNSPCRNEDAS